MLPADSIAAVLARKKDRVHFVGVGGSGLSALATYRALGGGAVSGSDRSLDSGAAPARKAELEACGIQVLPQDGQGASGASLVVLSRAVEDTIPDVRAALELGTPCIQRSLLLAAHVNQTRSIGITGTCGKSTVTALVFEILQALDRDPGLLTGGALRARLALGLPGNACRGTGPLVFEADESDDSLGHYRPQVSVVLNLMRDHREPEQVLLSFQELREHTSGPFVLSDDEALVDLRSGALIFGFGPEARLRASDLSLQGNGSRMLVDGLEVQVPLPGAHNAANALAALAACQALGVPLQDAARALTRCRGVSRRFELLGCCGGVEVVDDFAHNPAKIRAALLCAQARSPRVHAFFQPHGFAPTRFYREELVRTFAATLRAADALSLAPILFLGGTAQRSLTSSDLLADLEHLGQSAGLVARADWPAEAAASASPGDVMLVMGARDPSLSDVARAILEALPGSAEPAQCSAHET